MPSTQSAGIAGTPGQRWRNHTSSVWYQLVSSLRNPCRFCLTRHGHVRPEPWPLPFHDRCECEQLAIAPGASAPIEARRPADVVRRLSAAARVSLLGQSVCRLIDAGVVTLDDVVGADDWDLLTFTDLVRRKGLTKDQLERAGVDTAQAERAVSATADGG